MVSLGVRGGARGADHATWQHLSPTACGACWRAVHAQPLMLPSRNGLELTDAPWTRASGHLGTPWHTKAGVFTPREVVGPVCPFTVKRMSTMTALLVHCSYSSYATCTLSGQARCRREFGARSSLPPANLSKPKPKHTHTRITHALTHTHTGPPLAALGGGKPGNTHHRRQANPCRNSRASSASSSRGCYPLAQRPKPAAHPPAPTRSARRMRQATTPTCGGRCGRRRA